MPINVRCSGCKASFQAKDALAGRRVKCPQCKEPLTIPAARPKAAAGAGRSAHNPLLDILEQENVRAQSRGPVCENCGSEIGAGAVICVDCGYNQETGQMLSTEEYEDNTEAGAESSMSDAERIMAKAEKDIEDNPVSGDMQDFGDGAESYMIAMIAGIAGIIMIAIGLVIIFSMETIGEYIASSAVSFIASVGLYIAMGIWITIVAFSAKASHGIACVATGFLYCVAFGFMQGKSLILPVIIMIFAFAVGAASGAYTFAYGWTPDAQAASLMVETVKIVGLG
jgi:uncharacterized Zn finger protein (UPF0148 family)